jgi:hypothetical protein
MAELMRDALVRAFMGSFYHLRMSKKRHYVNIFLHHVEVVKIPIPSTGY